MFKGFDIKYPEYEVITPQTKLSYSVRSLSVQEEELLKGSLLTPSKINEHLNKCLFSAITKKPLKLNRSLLILSSSFCIILKLSLLWTKGVSSRLRKKDY